MSNTESEASVIPSWPTVETAERADRLPKSTMLSPLFWFRHYRKPFLFAAHTALIILAYTSSFLLRFDGQIPAIEHSLLLTTIPLVVFVKILVFYRVGLIRGAWRYSGMSDLMDIVVAAAVSSFVLGVLILGILHLPGFPRSILLLDLLLTVVGLGGSRFAVRAYSEYAVSDTRKKSTLIVGASEDGCTIVRELRLDRAVDYSPVGFIDDDRHKQGIKLAGLRVLGTTAELGSILQEYKIECVLIAIRGVAGSRLQEITGVCRSANVECKILPTITERLDANRMTNQLRSVRIEDLLGRPPVRLDLKQIRTDLDGAVVLITGAGGSIGSELVRQLAAFNVKRLVLLDRSENELVKVSVELAASRPNVEHIPVVADILDVASLKAVFGAHRPDFVFHAAAYKHVPIMEQYCFQAVINNIFGTYNVALVAREFRTAKFVLISTDKAVRPSNVMGVTKRVAELIVLSLQSADTSFIAVRFGNVLGSNGSVLPLFELQLARGEPLTVTHPDAERYFMTIPEAAQLVLQASTMAHSGEILELDMGAPVKILALAQSFIRLSGAEGKARIVFTGLRPGEKLSEELTFDSERLLATSHESIRVVAAPAGDFSKMLSWLDELSLLVDTRNLNGLVQKLREIVPEYAPSPEVTGRCTVDRHDILLGYNRARTALFVREAA